MNLSGQEFVMIIPSHPNAAPPTSDPQQAPVAPAHGGGIRTGGVYKPKDLHYDPAGKPIEFGSGRVLDQQVGGDLSGLAPDPRDDNFIEDTGIGPQRQLQRDIGAGVDNFSGRGSGKPPSTAIEPDGTEDPLAGIDVP
jgi:hypothetical protein